MKFSTRVRNRLVLLALVVFVCILGVFGVACATFRHADGSINVPGIISDARWGLSEACDMEWVNPTDCSFGMDSLAAADAIAAKNLPNVATTVRQLLIDAETKLPATSRLRPYLDGIIILLPATAS